MIDPVDPYLEAFTKAGASTTTIHVEATKHLDRTVPRIRGLGLEAGMSLNPATPSETIDYVLDALDLVLVMSVNPGFGGQSFNEAVLEKFPVLRQMFGAEVLLQIDGGINLKTASAAAAAGVDLFVAGSAIFRSDDYSAALAQLNQELGAVNERI